MKAMRASITLALFLAMTQAGSAGTLAQFFMYAGPNNYIGEIDVELYDQDKPVTVNNFVRLVEAGAYQIGLFHRCPSHFVLQGGGYNVFNPTLTNLIAPPYTNLSVVGNFGNITNEIKKGAFRSNTYGTIAMAKGSDPNSANSQFFFNLTNNAASLDNTNNAGGFTVFGHVVRGTNILNEFYPLTKGNGIVNLADTYGANGIFTDLPTVLVTTNPPPYNQLIYYTVSILGAQVSLNKTNGSRTITWNSVAGVTNNLEYATNLPPVWQVLYSTNANGNPITVTDSTTNNLRRFYRVHVLF